MAVDVDLLISIEGYICVTVRLTLSSAKKIELFADFIHILGNCNAEVNSFGLGSGL